VPVGARCLPAGRLSEREQVIPADNGIFDQSPAPLSHLLFDLFALQKTMVVPEGDGLRKLEQVFLQLKFFPMIIA
jgi:hypothetical protein